MFSGDEFDTAWQQFLLMRKKMRKPPTEYAQKLLLQKLDRLACGSTPRAVLILNQSIENNWLGLFELRDQGYRSYMDHEQTRKRLQQYHEDEYASPEQVQELLQSIKLRAIQ